MSYSGIVFHSYQRALLSSITQPNHQGTSPILELVKLVSNRTMQNVYMLYVKTVEIYFSQKKINQTVSKYLAYVAVYHLRLDTEKALILFTAALFLL